MSEKNIFKDNFFIFFALFSFIIHPISLGLVFSADFFNYRIINVPIAIGDCLDTIAGANILFFGIICILSLIVFVYLIIKKKFSTKFFLIPFVLIFSIVNLFLLYIYMDYLELDATNFFVQFNLVNLPFAYIPFVILFIVTTIIFYIQNRISQKNKCDK